MVAVTTTYEAELALNQPSSIFKAVGGIIFRAPMSVSVPAAFTTAITADLIQMDPLLWQRLGLLTKKDGVVFGRDVSMDSEESWGYNDPTRSDIVHDVTSAAFNLQETNRYALEMYDFVDLSAVVPDATTGEVNYLKPNLSATSYSRLIFMAVDGAGTTRRYKFKVMPRAQVFGVKDEVWQQAASTEYPLTIHATVDTTLGYAVRNTLAGPGQKLLNTVQHWGTTP